MSANKRYAILSLKHDCECVGISNQHSCVARSGVNILFLLFLFFCFFFMVENFTIVDLGLRVRSTRERCGRQMAENDVIDTNIWKVSGIQIFAETYT